MESSASFQDFEDDVFLDFLLLLVAFAFGFDAPLHKSQQIFLLVRIIVLIACHELGLHECAFQLVLPDQLMANRQIFEQSDVLDRLPAFLEDVLLDEHGGLPEGDHSELSAAELHEVGLWQFVLDALRARFLKLSRVDEVAGHLELAIELVGSVNQARNHGGTVRFGERHKRVKGVLLLLLLLFLGFDFSFTHIVQDSRLLGDVLPVFLQQARQMFGG